MAKALFTCRECGWTTPKWVGRCGECRAWGTVEENTPAGGRTKSTSVANPAPSITAIDTQQAERASSGLAEFDRVLGGGLVPGAVLLVAGEPGVGKSTLLLDIAARWARDQGTTLYVTGEESAAQVRMRAERINALADRLHLAAEADLGHILGHIDAVSPSLLIVDSVQTVASSNVEGLAGGVTQTREVTSALIAVAKRLNITTVLVGHVTKDGNVAGPRALEHLVDVVISFEGDRHGALRLVRAVKNRFGPCDEIGCFELVDDGIAELSDPSGLFLGNRTDPASGTAVTATIEGRRPFVAEVQALISPTGSPQPRRVTSGLDSARIAMMLGVLERRAGLRLSTQDCFVATVGGVRLTEPATDLAVALAVASSAFDRPLPADVIVIGEVGLAGDVRPVRAIDRRLSEAARLGFRRAITPLGTATGGSSGPMQVTEVATVGAALQAVGLAGRPEQ